MTRPTRGRLARQKVVAQREALRLVRLARRRGERIVLTNGCFDVLHAGHVRSLEEAAGLGDRLIVAVNGDASVMRLKGSGRPALPARVRCEVVAALACVDWVVRFDADTPRRLVERLLPDVLAKGGDWALDEIVGREAVEAAGGCVVRLRTVPGPRSSDLVASIRGRRR
jgi:D-beta-D-heptose 7-phosphate kinase/D-beta-D-heptose 1-phosphate adenosyltransferase